ncbi:MAG: peptidylprolyl isomerase [Bacteroidales bacterium]
MITTPIRSYLLAISFSLTAISSTIGAKSVDPVVLKLNGKSVHKSEFEYIFNKNNSNYAIEKKSLDEYLELFKNYKLKVAEAEALGLDTTKAFKDELKGYRTQLSQPYLVDRSVDEQLIREAYDRLREYVSVRHILVRVSPEATAKERKSALSKISSLRNDLINGADFAELAKESSDCPSSSKGGDLGFITGFMTVYPFETAAYNTPVGDISQIVETQFGYHIIKVDDRKADMGELLVAHIMKEVPRNATIEQVEASRQVIVECLGKLSNGEEFASLARGFSDDKYSASKGGELSWFGVNKLPKPFEEAAYALEIGELSDIVRTDYGWHIIKMLDKRSLASFEDKRAEIVRRLANDERASKGKMALVERLRKEYDVVNSKESLTDMLTNASDMSDSLLIANASSMIKPLVTIRETNYTQGDFVNYLVNKGLSENMKDLISSNIQQFEDDMIIKYEDEHLEEKYSEFRNLMQEYRDGILLFEISNAQVWDKASKDTAGLNRYFLDNRSKYDFESPRFKGYILQCKDQETAQRVRSIISTTPQDSINARITSEINVESQVARVSKGLFSKGDNKIVDALHFNATKLDLSGNLQDVSLLGKELVREPEEYTDVKGLVIADYQNWLENQWVESLRKKYKIKVNKKVVKSINQE